MCKTNTLKNENVATIENIMIDIHTPTPDAETGAANGGTIVSLVIKNYKLSLVDYLFMQETQLTHDSENKKLEEKAKAVKAKARKSLSLVNMFARTPEKETPNVQANQIVLPESSIVGIMLQVWQGLPLFC